MIVAGAVAEEQVGAEADHGLHGANGANKPKALSTLGAVFLPPSALGERFMNIPRGTAAKIGTIRVPGSSDQSLM